MIRSLLRWLGLERPASVVGLRPHRDVELATGYDDAYAKVLSAIELALGASVTLDDRRNGIVEAAIGLINNERVRCTLHALDASHTRVRVEAFFPAGAVVPPSSRAVDALATMLAAPPAT
jgi:hypothetical protein